MHQTRTPLVEFWPGPIRFTLLEPRRSRSPTPHRGDRATICRNHQRAYESSRPVCANAGLCRRYRARLLKRFRQGSTTAPGDRRVVNVPVGGTECAYVIAAPGRDRRSHNGFGEDRFDNQSGHRGRGPAHDRSGLRGSRRGVGGCGRAVRLACAGLSGANRSGGGIPRPSSCS